MATVRTGIPNAMQQRLEWQPEEGTAFHQLNDFHAQWKVYCFRTGKRYKEKKPTKEEKRKIYTEICEACIKGSIQLRILRKNSRTSCWIVQRVDLCECGTPLSWLSELEKGDRAVAVGKPYVPYSEWQFLAHTFFPAGYLKERPAQNCWKLSCRGIGCPGEMTFEWRFTGGTYLQGKIKRGYTEFVVKDTVVECTAQCKQGARPTRPVIMTRISQPPALTQERAVVDCLLCCEDDLCEWIELPCGKQVCVECFWRLIRTPPVVIARQEGVLVRFDPAHNREHCYTCPFCKVSYHPWTKIKHNARVEGQPVVARAIPVRDVVHDAYAYQTFISDGKVSAYVGSVEDYQELEVRHTEYLRLEARKRRRRQSDIFEIVASVGNDGYGRLQTLYQSFAFSRHEHEVLNFLDAVEALHDRNLDFGFLQRVAEANTTASRMDLINTAYWIGWYQDDGTIEVEEQLVLDLLQRKNLLEVIDLYSNNADNNESNDEEGNGRRRRRSNNNNNNSSNNHNNDDNADEGNDRDENGDDDNDDDDDDDETYIEEDDDASSESTKEDEELEVDTDGDSGDESD